MLWAAWPLFGESSSNETVTLHRQYREGATLHYAMLGSNREKGKTNVYQARADGVVTKDKAGTFVVTFTWSNLFYNGHPVPLPSSSEAIEQKLSLDPAFQLAPPDFRKVPPALIGPMADLLTFYVDVRLAMGQKNLHQAGDHADVKRSASNSWADHAHTLIGEDAVDFQITLASVNAEKKTAQLVVEHAPPAKPEIHLPADWMQRPVEGGENNGVQVVKDGAQYVASVGKETFTDRITLSLYDGRILSATMENPVQVLERRCSDQSLQQCGPADRYAILRHVEINAVP